MAKANKSNVVKNEASVTTEYALATTGGPTASPVAVVDPATNLEADGFQQQTVRVVSFKRLPVGALIEGKLLEVKPSTDPKIKNPLLLLQSVNGPKVLVPCVTVIDNALGKKPENFIGHDLRIIFRGKADKAKKGRNAPNLFDIATRAPKK